MRCLLCQQTIHEGEFQLSVPQEETSPYLRDQQNVTFEEFLK